jgi:glycerate 2-kinase
MTDLRSDARRDIAIAVHAAAVAGVDPRAETSRAVAARLEGVERPIWIIALGKASAGMAQAAVDAMHAQGLEPEGGIVIAPERVDPPHARVIVAVGNHPVPAIGSREASDHLGAVAETIGGRGTVFVLLSGGATSLVAAPATGVSERDLVWMFEALLTSGADITSMNAIRKRYTRWGAGRLARALAPARVHCLIVSDVVGDDVPSIGSGPCAPEKQSAQDIAALIERDGLEPFVPRPLRELLHEGSPLDAPPRDGDAAFERVECAVILGNRNALDAAATHARSHGISPIKIVAEPLIDDATFTAQRLVDELVRFREAGLPDVRGADARAVYSCMLWGGETTVRLGAGAPAAGGRCQELALAAADALRAEGERGDGISILAAGTDGRDGNTDAAGAVVDGYTWDAVRNAGRDPADDLAGHRSHDALDAVGALLRTGLSGTNVGDVVIGIVERPTRQALAR